jgi:hypothetical protein
MQSKKRAAKPVAKPKERVAKPVAKPKRRTAQKLVANVKRRAEAAIPGPVSSSDPTAIHNVPGDGFEPVKPNAMGLTVEQFSVEPFRCVNCSAIVEGAAIYCTTRCAAEAGFVRYVRRRLADGTSREPDILCAIQIKLIKHVEGGYDREVPDQLREAVRRRERGLCRVCGKAGHDADHIDGSGGDDLENLQYLCTDCHKAKTTVNFALITDDWKLAHPDEWRRRQWLVWRVRQPEPVQLCDDAENWPKIENEITRARKSPGQGSLF